MQNKSLLAASIGSEVTRFQSTSISGGDDVIMRVYQNRTTTTNATPATIQTLTPIQNTTYCIEATVFARRTGGTSDQPVMVHAFIFARHIKMLVVLTH
jgi:hypothetical protein